MPTSNVSTIATVTGWSFVFYAQALHSSGYSSSSGPSRMSSTSLSWMKAVWETPSGKKWQGKSLLLAVTGEKWPHWQYPRALPSALWNTFSSCRCSLIWAAFSSCHHRNLAMELEIWSRRGSKRQYQVQDPALWGHSVLAQPLSWGAAPPMKGCCWTIVSIVPKTLKVMSKPHSSGSGQAWLVTEPFSPKSTLPQWHILFQKSCCIFKFCSHPSSIAKAGSLGKFLRHLRKLKCNTSAY